MEFKRFKRKGLIFNNNSIGLGLELRIGKKIKVFRIERLTKEDIRHATIVYLDRCNNDDFQNCTWGDGDSLDRERVRDILTEKFGYEYDSVTV